MLINISLKQTEGNTQEIVCSNTCMLESGMTLFMHDEQHFTHKHMNVFKASLLNGSGVFVISKGST